MNERRFNPASDASLLAAHLDGASVRALAKTHGVSSSSVHRAIQRARDAREREAQDKVARAKQRHSSWRARAATADARPENRRQPKAADPEPEPAPKPAKVATSKRKPTAKAPERELTDSEAYELWLDERALARGEISKAEFARRRKNFRRPRQFRILKWGAYDPHYSGRL